MHFASKIASGCNNLPNSPIFDRIVSFFWYKARSTISLKTEDRKKYGNLSYIHFNVTKVAQWQHLATLDKILFTCGFRYNAHRNRFWPGLCARPCWGSYSAPSDLLVDSPPLNAFSISMSVRFLNMITWQPLRSLKAKYFVMQCQSALNWMICHVFQQHALNTVSEQIRYAVVSSTTTQ